ncbi:MAG: hypothetical protein HYU99_01860 [Deltaproteobacteria bacterium]|nr:hypothetical protein [Deltaproteobacteria bacterium]
MPTVQQFPFDKLKKCSAKEAEIFSWIARYFPAPGLAPPFVERLVHVLKRYLGEGFHLRFESVFEADYGKFIAGLADRFVCLAVSLTPLPEKVMIELDSDFSFALIDKILGGEGAVPRLSRSPTRLEEGVLQFFCVKILKELADLMKQAPFKFRFDKIAVQTQALKALSEENRPMVLLTFRAGLTGVEGYIRLALPHPVLLSMAANPSPFMDRLLTEVPNFEGDRFSVFDHFRTVLWGEVGKVTLTVAELKQIDRGDIVLFDESYSSLEENRIGGSLRLKAGDGNGGWIEARVVEGDKTQSADALKVKLERVIMN